MVAQAGVQVGVRAEVRAEAVLRDHHPRGPIHQDLLRRVDRLGGYCGCLLGFPRVDCPWRFLLFGRQMLGAVVEWW